MPGISAIIAAIVAFIGRKMTTATGTVAAFVLLTAAFIACINSILSAIVGVLAMPAWISTFVGMWIPADFGAVLGAIISAHTCRAAYDLAMLKVKAINQAN